ncbi:MAG: hypothetical protein Ta2G_01600 [Termitinemataceae bacterium]|nr:MAG: hypothetical protein Ta2G_01600 [Termitinemataceae bacterium]
MKKSKETLEERIEKSSELFKQQMRDKAKEVVPLDGYLKISNLEFKATKNYAAHYVGV